jgi:hypothetical protein
MLLLSFPLMPFDFYELPAALNEQSIFYKLTKAL